MRWVNSSWVGPRLLLFIDYVEPAGLNAFSIRAEFEADRIRLSFRDRTGIYGEQVILGAVRER